MIVSIFELERYGILYSTWDKADVPPEALKLAKEEVKDMVPTCIVKHPIYGWFILQTGQGPYPIWGEKKYEWNDQNYELTMEE